MLICGLSMKCIFNNMVPEASCGYRRRSKIPYCSTIQRANPSGISALFASETENSSRFKNPTNLTPRQLGRFIANSGGSPAVRGGALWSSWTMPDSTTLACIRNGVNSKPSISNCFFFRLTVPTSIPSSGSGSWFAGCVFITAISQRLDSSPKPLKTNFLNGVSQAKPSLNSAQYPNMRNHL